jgi:hypothetical protein
MIQFLFTTVVAMALYLSNLTDAYGPLLESHWEKKEMPQHYDYLPTQFNHSEPRRHMLGIVGGNEASLIKGNMVDLESDLRRINIPNTFAPWRQYQPPQKGDTEIVRNNCKTQLNINVQKDHLPVYQMMAYPAVVAPLEMVSEVCMKPEKY